MSRFPSDWRTMRMGEAATWLSGGTPSTSNPQYWGGHIPWISAASLKDFHVSDSERRITSLGATRGTRLIPAGATIFVVRGMSLKNEFRVGITCREVAFGQDCKALIPTAGIYPQFFAFAVLGQANTVLKMVDEAGHGTGRLPTDQLLNLPIGIPPLAEQKRIVEILDTMDEAILSAGRLVAKLEEVRQGLLHDLITYGISRSGRLRCLDTHSPLFQESPFGRIPSTWLTMSIGEACSVVQDGTHLPPPRVVDGPLLLSVRNILEGKLVLTDADTSIPWAFFHAMHVNWEIARGDVCLAVVGATIGKLARVGDLPAFTIQRSLTVLRGRPDVLDNGYLFEVLSTPALQRQIWARVNQTAQPGIYLAELRRLLLPIPSLSEQRHICDQLAAIRARSESVRREGTKLAILKQGLIDDLLSGRVRVGDSE